MPDLTRIAAALYFRNRSDVWLAQLVHWAKGSDPKDREGNFWKRKLQTEDVAVKKLADFLETGTIAEQFDARLHGKRSNCLLAVPGEEKDLLLRDLRHLDKYAPAGRGFEYEPPEDDYPAPVGKGFDVEEA
jgi:hypothetical protein